MGLSTRRVTLSYASFLNSLCDDIYLVQHRAFSDIDHHDIVIILQQNVENFAGTVRIAFDNHKEPSSTGIGNLINKFKRIRQVTEAKISSHARSSPFGMKYFIFP